MLLLARLTRHEGRLAIVTNARRDAVDAKRAQDDARDAYGEVVWSDAAVLVSSSENKLLGSDGGKRVVHRGEHGISRKAIAQGMPDASAEPVCSCAFLRALCTRDRG